MNLSNWQKALFATLIAQSIWGAGGPLVKIALGNLPPFGFLFLRSLLTCLVLFPIYEFKLFKIQPEITTKDVINIFLAGFLGVFVNIALYFWGQQLTTVTDAWIITSVGTIFILIYSYIFLHERLNRVVYIGVVISFIGALVIIGEPLLTAGKGNTFGNLLMLGATIAAALSYFPLKELIPKFHALSLAFFQFFITMILTIPLFLLEFSQNPYWLSQISSSSVLILIYEVIGSSILAYALSNWGLKFLPASLSSAVGYAATIIAVGLGIIFLHEHLTFFFILGSLLIALGLFLAESRHPSHPINKLHHGDTTT